MNILIFSLILGIVLTASIIDWHINLRGTIMRHLNTLVLVALLVGFLGLGLYTLELINSVDYRSIIN